MKIVYFGTPRFAADVLAYLLKEGIPIQAIVTKPDKPLGRSKTPLPVPVKQIAAESSLSIPIYQPEIVSSLEFAPVLEDLKPDLFVVVAYGEILKTHLLEMPAIGCINLHASLLPKYRGAAPIQQAIINGEKESGVTIMHMAKKMDAGDIIEAVKVPIALTATYGELEKDLCSSGKELLLKVIRDFERGIIKRSPQDHSAATYAPKIELEDCEIDFGKPSMAVHNLIRGVNPEPGAFCWLEVKGIPKRLKIFKSFPHDHESGQTPGAVIEKNKDGLHIQCGKGSIEIQEVQLEGKKRMSAMELFRGMPEGSWKIVNAVKPSPSS